MLGFFCRGPIPGGDYRVTDEVVYRASFGVSRWWGWAGIVIPLCFFCNSGCGVSVRKIRSSE